MNYTEEDCLILKKASKDIKRLTKRFESLLSKLEIETDLFGENKCDILEKVYKIVDTQDCFDITNYSDYEYIDISWENLVFSIYMNENNVYIGEDFEIWNDSGCYCIGTLSIKQIENILKNKGE